MSIRVVCPHGHVLDVKDSFAGKTGLCPMCKARVEVPEVPIAKISEDAIMNILGPHVSIEDDAEPEAAMPVRSALEREHSATPKKSCHQCNREISVGIHICPFCHTYIANLADF